jgi:hypothetical protein
MSEVEEGAGRLEKAADVYSKAVLRFEKAEEVYERKMAMARVEADMAHERRHNKLPSQERRHDLALHALYETQEGVCVEYFAAKADKEAQAVLYRALSASVSARQSLLKALSGA